MWNYENGINDLCWINGFSELTSNPTVAVQLKNLDRNRNKYFNKFRRKIREIKSSDKEHVNVKSNRQIIYFGKPFSYYYHAHEKSKQSSTLAVHTG